MSGIDYNINNYTVPELLAILDLDDPDIDDVMDATNTYIRQFNTTGQLRISLFFQDMQSRLVSYFNQLEKGVNDEYTPDTEQTNKWWKFQALPQDDTVQKDKITDRAQKIDIYDNHHVPMKRQELGVNNTFDTKVAQDKLNPNLKNITSRYINIDSQFRQASGGSESLATDFTLDLSDPLNDVLSLRLYSIQIPYTWYTIDYLYGNTCFWLTNNGNTFRISIEPGNYSPADFVSIAFPNAIASAGFTVAPLPSISYNSNNAKVTMNFDGCVDPSGNTITGITEGTEFNILVDPYFTFFDITGTKDCYADGSYPCSNISQTHTFSGTLGWLMGYREPIIPVFNGGGNVGSGVINLYGTKYFIIVLDDYNQNHINNGLVTIAEPSKRLDLPSYYDKSQPYVCVEAEPNIYNAAGTASALANLGSLTDAELAALGLNPSTAFESLYDKLDFGSGKVPQVLPSAPRTLTQAQIYTINEIVKSRNKTISFRAKAPTNSDTFAIIPIKYSGLKTGDVYVDFSGSLGDSERTYFGPVNIDRMRIRLLDDKGNVVDLHGGEWCMTLICENLYQY